METLSERYEQMIAVASAQLPEQSPALLAHIAHVRAHALLSDRAGASDADFAAWALSVADNSTWLALSDAERAAFNAAL